MRTLYGLLALATWALSGAIGVGWCAGMLWAYVAILAWFQRFDADPQLATVMAALATIILAVGTGIGLVSALIYSLTPATPPRRDQDTAPLNPPRGGSGVAPAAPKSRTGGPLSDRTRG